MKSWFYFFLGVMLAGFLAAGASELMPAANAARPKLSERRQAADVSITITNRRFEDGNPVSEIAVKFRGDTSPALVAGIMRQYTSPPEELPAPKPEAKPASPATPQPTLPADKK